MPEHPGPVLNGEKGPRLFYFSSFVCDGSTLVWGTGSRDPPKFRALLVQQASIFFLLSFLLQCTRAIPISEQISPFSVENCKVKEETKNAGGYEFVSYKYRRTSASARKQNRLASLTPWA